MMRAGWIIVVVAAAACDGPRLTTRPEDCPAGCFNEQGVCVDGRSETACGSGGATCGVCALSEACVDHVCKAEQFIENEKLTYTAGFQVVGDKPLAADVTRLTTLQLDDDMRPTMEPVVYGLRTEQKDIVSLGAWASFGDATTSVASAVAPGDAASATLTFNGVFTGNRWLVMTGYSVGAGTHRLFLHSTNTGSRPVGTTSESVAGPFAAAPMGDFYFLSAPGVMSQSGFGVYGFLDGPFINSTRRVAQYAPAATAGVGLMATAQKNIGLFGAYDTSTQQHVVVACTLAQWQDAYIAAANRPWALNLQSCPVVYAGGSETVALSRMSDGFAVLVRGATSQTIHYIPLVVTVNGQVQSVTTGPAQVVAEGPNAAFVELLTDYGNDLLVVVRGSLARTVQRVRRQ
ncbi:MAG: hypothetical protein JNG84_08700 [Archangium sp.]|nr:hypothetical protein [Archangium sp.]